MAKLGRLLGIDYGRVRIGVAVSDETRMIARPLCCLEYKKDFIEKLQKELKPLLPIDEVIIGLPLDMRGKDSAMTEEVRKFATYLEQALRIPIKLWDERLTSAQAERQLRDAGMKRKERAEFNDTLAAALILQSYLDSL
ncbi:MAG TPA: Holliday junction resolvase RuvX [Rhabdochlamydiaceae bacterium]|nr:Holliday junction resolvase RuvX [Rhabdochlamydiaceae bacterium]